MKLLSHIISWVFLPLNIPLMLLVVIFFIPTAPKSFYLFDSPYHYPSEIKLLFLLLFGIFTFIAPAFSLLILKMNKSISSLTLDNQAERGTPISIVIFYALILYFFLIFQDQQGFVPNIIKGLVLGGCLASAIAYIYTKFDKISLHGIGAGTLFGFLLIFYAGMEVFPILIFLGAILISGLILSARLVLKAHNLNQVLSGFLIGFLTQFLTIYFYP